MAVNNLGQNIQRVIDGLDLIKDELTLKTGEDQSTKTIEQLPAVISGIDTSVPFITNAVGYFSEDSYLGTNNDKTVLEMKDIIQKYWKPGEIQSFYGCFSGNNNITQEFINFLIPYMANSANFNTMFANNTVITEVDFPDISNCAPNCSISGLFQRCSNLDRVYMGDLGNNIELNQGTMGMFVMCSKLREVEFENTSGVSTNSMFFYTGTDVSLAGVDTKIINLDLSNFNGFSLFQNVTDWSAYTYFPKQIINLKMIQYHTLENYEFKTITPYSESTGGAKHVLNKLTIAPQPNGTITYGGVFNLLNCSFERSGLVEFFNSLPTQLGTEPSLITITLTGNPGVATLTEEDKAIATNKGWILAL